MSFRTVIFQMALIGLVFTGYATVDSWAKKNSLEQPCAELDDCFESQGLIGETTSVPTEEDAKRIKVISHNIAGGPKHKGSSAALNYVVEQTKAWEPDVVALQEVCASQRRSFREAFPNWGTAYIPMRTKHAKCGPGPQGQLLASRWPMSDVTISPLGGTDGDKVFTLLCADFAVPAAGERKLRACVTHLRAFQSKESIAARTAQIEVIGKTLTRRIKHGNQPVIVAGDFNSRPGHQAMDGMYRLSRLGKNDGPGRFYEADQTDPRYFSAPKGGKCGKHACRSGKATHNTAKYDYVFFSENAFSSAKISGLAANGGTSDHRLVRGAAYLKP